MTYYIMNKDEKVLFFTITDNSTDFNIEIMGVYNESLVPFSLRNKKNIQNWLELRLLGLNRLDLWYNVNNDGVKILQSLTDMTHFISLTDTYWVKKEGSEIKWFEISPYSIIDNNIFSGQFIHLDGCVNILGRYLIDPFISGCWHKIDNTIYYYKRDYYIQQGVTCKMSPYAEYYASQLAQFLGLQAVEYELTEFDNTTCTRSKCLSNEKTGICMLEDINIRIGVKDTENLFMTDFGEDMNISCQKLLDIMIIDFLTLNIDRTTNNTAVFFDTDTLELKGLCIAFDFNRALASNIEKYGDLGKYIELNRLRVNTLMERFKYILSVDGDYVKSKINKASTYTFTGLHSSTANEVLRHQLELAYSML